MPILSEISRRFHLLTTDAKPDPPRGEAQSHTHNLKPSTLDDKIKKKAKSTPTTPVSESLEQSNVVITQRQNSVPNDATPVDNADYSNSSFPGDTKSSTSEQKEQRKSGFKTKTKSKQYKQSQGASVVSYNIINSNGVKIGSRTSYICNVNQFATNNGKSSENSQYSEPKFRTMPADVDCLSTCDDEITLDDIFIIKTHVGHGWRDVARRLSYSEGQIEQFEENYKHRGVDEVIYQLLLDWKQANTKNADIGSLVKALWACQEYDCAERLTTARNKAL